MVSNYFPSNVTAKADMNNSYPTCGFPSAYLLLQHTNPDVLTALSRQLCIWPSKSVDIIIFVDLVLTYCTVYYERPRWSREEGGQHEESGGFEEDGPWEPQIE